MKHIDLREALIDFALPFTLLIILGFLIYSGKNGEVKTLFAATVGWMIKSGVTLHQK